MQNNIRLNLQIKATELRVIDENNQNIGVMTLQAALKLAQEKGLDLVEIAPTAKPPVAKIISFDKFRYQQSKKEKEQRSQQKRQENKQIKIGLGSAINDLRIKARKIDEFLAKGHHIEVFLTLRGREKGKKDLARVKLDEFLKIITVELKVLQSPKFGFNGLAVQIVKK